MAKQNININTNECKWCINEQCQDISVILQRAADVIMVTKDTGESTAKTVSYVIVTLVRSHVMLLPTCCAFIV
jgi:hypothetical protein